MLEVAHKTLLLSCLDDRRDALISKTDRLRKMKGVVDDTTFNNLMEIYEYELQLMTDTHLRLIEK